VEIRGGGWGERAKYHSKFMNWEKVPELSGHYDEEINLRGCRSFLYPPHSHAICCRKTNSSRVASWAVNARRTSACFAFARHRRSIF
jgi:hypothetical protein